METKSISRECEEMQCHHCVTFQAIILMKRLLVIPILVCSLLLGCAKETRISRPDVYGITDVRGTSPEQLLQRMISIRRNPPLFYINEDISKWLTLEDVKKLATHIHSTKPCLHAISPLSSLSSEEYSTEGIEAAHMIKGYIENNYPLNLAIENSEWKKNLLSDVQKWLSEQHLSRH